MGRGWQPSRQRLPLSARKGELEKTGSAPTVTAAPFALPPAPSEALAAIATQKGSIRLIKIPEDTPSPTSGHRQSVESMVFSADGNSLFSASLDQTLCTWRKKDSTYELQMTLKIAAAFPRFALAPTPGSRGLVRLERAVRVWHLDRSRIAWKTRAFGW